MTPKPTPASELREITIEPAIDEDWFIVTVGDVPTLQLHWFELRDMRNQADAALGLPAHERLAGALFAAQAALQELLADEWWTAACDLTEDDLDRLSNLSIRVSTPNQR